MTTQIASTGFSPANPFNPGHFRITVAEAMIAASAAGLSLLAEVPIWAMFIGWISYFTRGMDLRNGAVNLGCVIIGVGLGMAAGLSVSALAPVLGTPAQIVVVFGLALVVLSLRFLPTFNNLLGFFLGLVAFFASHLQPGLPTLLTLSSAALLGAAAAWTASTVQHRLERAPAGERSTSLRSTGKDLSS